MLLTFNGNLDDVVRRAQAVGGRASVVAGVGFAHVHNLQGFLVVEEGNPAARQLSSIFLPRHLRRGPAAISVIGVALSQRHDAATVRPLTSLRRCIPAPGCPLAGPSWCWWRPKAS